MPDTFNGFHLPKSVSSVADLYRCDSESITSSATSKHRIDMLFNDTRSVISDYNIGQDHEFRQTKSLTEGGTQMDEYYIEPTAKNDVQVRIEKMFSEVSSSEQVDASSANNKFLVTHLGSMMVKCKITSIDGLQEPLKELYFKHCTQKKKNSAGFIQISDKGLLIEYSGNYGGKIEKLNPFSTIAIWASLRFSYRKIDSEYEYAFLPIVSNSDKDSLYQKLNENIASKLKDNNNSPMFVVVMREPDSPTKQLVCHGFLCESSEDAVVIAATLYRVLMSKLGRNRVLKSKNQRRRMKPLSNKLTSIGETSNNETNEPEFSYSEIMKRAPPPPPPPPAPPQQLPPLPPTRPPRKQKEMPKSSKINDNIECKPYKKSDLGDILTKVAIPRSSSFLNTNRLGCRYDTKPMEQLQKMNVGPLGFTEMFNELQSQEGLKTVDEILNVIIKAEGMSFNELKPIYKEFLLKLALVLSKDELFNRSKLIMNLQKKRKSSRFRKIITTKNGLKNVLRKPLVKLKTSKSTSCSCRKTTSKIYSDCTSTDSFFLTEKPKLETKLRQTKNLSRHKSFKFRSQRITSTSEDSDYPNINIRRYKSRMRDDVLRPSSSGYFSFSECSYDTESCTCTSADKCYCSLIKSRQGKRSKTLRTNYSICSCATLECRKQNKCYCGKTKNLSLMEQLKQKGFAVSESSLSPDNTNQRISVKDKSNTKLSKSLEYLENSKKYKNRTDPHDSNQKAFPPCRHNYKYSISCSSDSSRTSQKRSTSSDNLVVDYNMFAKSEDQRKPKEIHRNCKRSMGKQNVVYAELACPQIVPGGVFNRNCSMPSVIPRRESPSLMALYPHHAPIRTCSCACTCPMFTGEPFPSFHSGSRLSSTPFHRINMENIFGYYP